MVQTKKFENTFVNEYMAWNLHDRDVEQRAKAEEMREGLNTARIETAKNLFSMGISLEKSRTGYRFIPRFCKTALRPKVI